MKITNNVHNARNYGDKELTDRFICVAFKDGAFHEVVDARCYMSRSADGASPVYASVWIQAPGFSASGKGRANGYGYHKASAAIGDALTSAGVTLDKSINGAGESAVRDALDAIARHLGFEHIHVIT